MHTVQHYLRTLRRDKLLDTYIEAYPPEYDDCRDGKMKNVRRRYRRLMRTFIERLSAMRAEEGSNGKQILYARRTALYPDDFEVFIRAPQIEFNLVYAAELLEKGAGCEDYAYDFTPQAEIMSFLVADTPFTQEHIYDLIADVLYEASFYGYYQEHLPDLNELRKKAERWKAELLTKQETDAAGSSGKDAAALNDGAESKEEAGCGAVCAEEAEVIDEETRVNEALNEAIGQFNAYYRAQELNAVRDGLSSDMSR